MEFIKEKMGTIRNNTMRLYCDIKIKVTDALQSNKGEGYVDTLIKMAIAVVIGSIILFAIIKIVGDENDGVLGTLSSSIDSFFSKTASS